MPNYTRNLPLPQNQFVFDGNNGKIYFLPQGHIGDSASFAATSSRYALSMSANTNDLHTPGDGTSSYVYFSASQNQQGPYSSIGLYWTRTGSQHITRVITNHNSSSANSGYGLLGGGYFTFTASAHAPKNKYYKLYYKNPESRVAATSSTITFPTHPTTSFSSSQGYTFQITASNQTSIYNLQTTQSKFQPDFEHSSSSEGGKTITTIPFFFQYSASAAILAGGGGNSSSAKTGVRNLLNVINENRL